MASSSRPADDPLVDNVRREQAPEPRERTEPDAARPAGSPRLDAVRRALAPRGGRRRA